MKGSILGHRYEWIMLTPSALFDPSDRWAEYSLRKEAMVEWCTANLTNWGHQGNVFWFTYERDYELFLLKWA